jgi:hypothetical protein
MLPLAMPLTVMSVNLCVSEATLPASYGYCFFRKQPLHVRCDCTSGVTRLEQKEALSESFDSLLQTSNIFALLHLCDTYCGLFADKQQTIKSFFKRGPATSILADKSNDDAPQSSQRAGVVPLPQSSDPSSNASDLFPPGQTSSQGPYNPTRVPVTKRVTAASAKGFLRQGSGVQKVRGKVPKAGQSSMRGFLRASSQQKGRGAAAPPAALRPAEASRQVPGSLAPAEASGQLTGLLAPPEASRQLPGSLGLGCDWVPPLRDGAEGQGGQPGRSTRDREPAERGGEGENDMAERNRTGGTDRAEVRGPASSLPQSAVSRTGNGGLGDEGGPPGPGVSAEPPGRDHVLPPAPGPISDKSFPGRAVLQEVSVVCSGVFTEMPGDFGAADEHQGTAVLRGGFIDAQLSQREPRDPVEGGGRYTNGFAHEAAGSQASLHRNGDGEEPASPAGAANGDIGVGPGGVGLSQGVPTEGGRLGQPVGRVEAVAAWQRIQQLMKPPKCKGHGEECVVRHVKKGGVNQGELLAASH